MFQSCLNYKERTSKYVAEKTARPVLWISAPWARWQPGVSVKKTCGNSMKPLEIRRKTANLWHATCLLEVEVSINVVEFHLNKSTWLQRFFFPQVLICRLLEGSFQLGFWEILQCSKHLCWDHIDKVTPHQTAQGGVLIEYIYTIYKLWENPRINKSQFVVYSWILNDVPLLGMIYNSPQMNGSWGLWHSMCHFWPPLNIYDIYIIYDPDHVPE